MLRFGVFDLPMSWGELLNWRILSRRSVPCHSVRHGILIGTELNAEIEHASRSGGSEKPGEKKMIAVTAARVRHARGEEIHEN